MRDLLPVLRVLGMLMVMFALSMLLPFAVSWFTDDGIWRIYPWAIGITAAAGLSLWIGLDHFRRELQPRLGVALSWGEQLAGPYFLCAVFGRQTVGEREIERGRRNNA